MGGDVSILESHHKDPSYRGGSDTDENMEVLTRVEHALTHYEMAKDSEDPNDIRANYWAVSKIVTRMKPEELQEFNSRIKQGH